MILNKVLKNFSRLPGFALVLLESSVGTLVHILQASSLLIGALVFMQSLEVSS